MIIDRLENLYLYAQVHPEIAEIIRYIEQNNLYALQVGKHQIDSKFYILRDSYETKPLEECSFEGHQNYADLQIVLTGSEWFGYAAKQKTEKRISVPYSLEKDVEKYEIHDFSKVLLTEGMFALVFPEDLHMPKLLVNQSTHVEKAVIKFKI